MKELYTHAPLYASDDKIELNNKISAALEQMAQAIFSVIQENQISIYGNRYGQKRPAIHARQRWRRPFVPQSAETIFSLYKSNILLSSMLSTASRI